MISTGIDREGIFLPTKFAPCELVSSFSNRKNTPISVMENKTQLPTERMHIAVMNVIELSACAND